ncbi:unnamed protein product [Cuscuta epithymum]|uniref:BHLH domain-containing protein n=1 Tax=Cuscuta epithymum TaxID=186058 RepID=A0AAV0E817_9ASTE|nr:unnamed protein product [Cuscuta epithymum]
MGYLLKEVLKILCGVNTWSYAVFWKLSCQNPKVLVWEDCYYEPVIYSTIQGFIPGNMNTEPAIQNWSSCWSPNNVSQTGEKVQLLVNKMMVENQFSAVGEGLVGRAAATGYHQWILSEGYCREAHPVEVLKELSLQFSAGMQTVAVIPVLPHGVVQLGSSKVVIENRGVMNDVRMLIGQLGWAPPGSLRSDEQHVMKQPQVHHRQTSSQTSEYYVNLRQNQMRKEVTLNPNIWQNQHSLNADSIPSLNSHSCMNGSSSEFDGNMGIVENDLFQELGSVLTQNNENRSSNGPTMLDFSYDTKDEYGVLQSGLLDDNHQDPCVHSSGDDLFDILGADFKNKLLNRSWNNGQEGPNTKDMDHDDDSIDYNNLVDFVTSTRSTKQSLDDNVSCHTTLTTMSSSSGPNASCSYGRVGVSTQMQGELFGCPKSKSRVMASSFDSSSKESNPQTSSIYGSQVSSWVEQACAMKKNTTSVSTVGSKKPDELTKPTRKRLKPGENPRPRPKDRQMIQDRVKELREIVPNGAKCSIDSLLERTIKHMLFLQSVKKHADKLKQTGESKIIGKEGGIHLKDNFEGGATWAYEIGSESTMCPIIVEDMNQPGQMLVEMLCEQSGFFLEIAEIIRGLGLTILKGVMEMKNDKIWAQFAVEADKDITRMEIFMSLVNLFKQTTISCNDNEE